jgi:hypothetical protein
MRLRWEIFEGAIDGIVKKIFVKANSAVKNFLTALEISELKPYT